MNILYIWICKKLLIKEFYAQIESFLKKVCIYLCRYVCFFFHIIDLTFYRIKRANACFYHSRYCCYNFIAMCFIIFAFIYFQLIFSFTSNIFLLFCIIQFFSNFDNCNVNNFIDMSVLFAFIKKLYLSFVYIISYHYYYHILKLISVKAIFI